MTRRVSRLCRRRRSVGLACAAWIAVAPAAGQEDPFADLWIETGVARVEALDKVTGRVSVIELPLDEPTRFGTLNVRVRACYRRPPELPPDAAAFLEIDEQRLADRPGTPLFRGWMFASSPGLSALEHPVYDVIVLDCLAMSDNQSDGGAEAGSE